MKKIVGFTILLLLLISSLVGGMHLSKHKANKSLFEALAILNEQKQESSSESQNFDSGTRNCTVSIAIHFKDNEKVKTKYGTGIIASLNKKDGEALIFSCEHLFREDGYSLFGIEIYLYGLENSQAAINGEYLGGCASFDFALLRIGNSDILNMSKAESVVFQDAYSEGQDVYAVGNALGKGISI